MAQPNQATPAGQPSDEDKLAGIIARGFRQALKEEREEQAKEESARTGTGAQQGQPNKQEPAAKTPTLLERFVGAWFTD